MGGDLPGITKRMDHMKELGIDAIYLNPIFEAGSYHAYDTFDYMKVSEHFGTDSDLKQMVDAAHKDKIRVILDCVFNHSGVKFYAFENLRYQGEASEYKDWYFVKHFPITVERGQTSYRTFSTSFGMPKLNTDNPETKRYLLNVAGYWIDYAGIDGWRLDVADEVSEDFWRSFRTRIKEKKKDALIINETWKDAHRWLQGDQHDSAMNYRFKDAVLDFYRSAAMTSEQLEARLSEVREDYPEAVLHTMYNLIGSHDTPRVLTEMKGDKRKVSLAVVTQFTYPGMPAIYYGDEIGMEGGRDPDCRRNMIWDRSKWDIDLYNLHKSLIQLRKSHRALREGSYHWLGVLEDSTVYGFTREYGRDKLAVYTNKSSKTVKLKARVDLQGLLLGSATVEAGTLTLPPKGFGIFLLK